MSADILNIRDYRRKEENNKVVLERVNGVPGNVDVYSMEALCGFVDPGSYHYQAPDKDPA